jgi:2-polyprenyl-6-methoxyphenol hydroxylase-like FAD-dependent oxidoreductase
LRTPTIRNAVKNAEPLGEIARYGITASEWRHFERLERLPCGVLPVADAICRYNPVYGQGMSVAALEACILRRLLGTRAVQDEGLAALAPAFFTEVEPLIETAWEAAAIPDLVLSETTGQRPADFEDRLGFRLALIRLAVKEPVTHRLMVEVQHLLKLQHAFRDPELLRRIQPVIAEIQDAKRSRGGSAPI